MVTRIDPDLETFKQAIMALAKMRGWALASSKDECAFLLPLIDLALEAFGPDIRNIIAQISGEALEAFEPKQPW